ncbi:hypothetical protein P3S68_030023 [Capsicum galapagoense]
MEDAWKHQEAKAADLKAKLGAIAEEQRKQELQLEEKKRLERPEVLPKSTLVSPMPAEPSTVSHPSEPGATAPPAATASAPTPGKYVPRFRRENNDVAGQAPPPETERRGSGGRPDDPSSDSHPSEPGANAPPATTSTAPVPGKYVPRFRRENIDVAGQAPPRETERRGNGRRPDDRSSDRWGCYKRKPP